jgi:hypothetical protein
MSSEHLIDDDPITPAASPSYYRVFIAAILDDGQLVYSDQITENGPFTSTATRLGTTSYAPAPLSAWTTLDGYVSILAQDKSTHNLTYLAENRAATGDRFAHPVDLGRPAGVSAFGNSLLTTGLNGLTNVFALSNAKDGTIWWKYENPAKIVETVEFVTPPGVDEPVQVVANIAYPPDQPWSDWVQLPGASSRLTACANADGRIILCSVNSGRAPYINFQTGTDPLDPEIWAGWQPMIDGMVVGLDQIEMAMDANSLVHIFGRSGSRIYMKVQHGVNSDSFSDWVLFAAFDAQIQDIAVSHTAGGGLYVAAHIGSGNDSPIYATYQVADQTHHWTTPRVVAFMRGTGPTAMSLFPNADGSLNMFLYNGADRTLSYTAQESGTFWRTGWTPLGEKVANFAVTQDVTPSASDIAGG